MENKATATLYETLFIVHPDQGGRVKEYIDRFKKIVEELHGTVTHVEEWGVRDLAYRIQKQAKGYYTLLQYRSSVRVVEELERTMKLSDGILRYLTVRLEEGAAESQRPKPKEISPGARGSEETMAKVEPQS
jgi:small subunit ribosomal protein S6